MIEKAITFWNLDSVQITLDGTEEIYNKTKAYVSAVANPYRIVMNNIRRLLEHNIRVIIRLNLDKHNMQDLERLVDELSEKLGSNKLLEVYTHVLFENAGFSPIERDEESKKLLYERHAKLSNIIHQKGLGKKLKSLPSLKTHNCMADTNNSLAVYPDGRLFKCEHIEMGDEIGTIREGIIQKAGIEKFITRMELKECISCPLYPSCILLKNCQGVSDKEWHICEYSIVEAENNLKEHYKHYKHKR